MTLPGIFSKLTQFAGDNQTTILTGMGVTGVVTTAYFAGRASFKAAELIEKEELRRRTGSQKHPTVGRQAHLREPDQVEMTTKEKIREVWPLYIPPVLVGATTITAIVMANHQASKKIAALTVASGISERALQEYKAKVIEKFGERKAVDVHDSIIQDRVSNTPGNREVVIVDNGDVLCFDVLTGRYFKSNVEKIRRAMNDVNFDLIAHDYASLSSFYGKIGLDPTPYSDYVGWRVDDHPEVIISSVLSPDNQACIAVDFESHPHPHYSDNW